MTAKEKDWALHHLAAMQFVAGGCAGKRFLIFDRKNRNNIGYQPIIRHQQKNACKVTSRTARKFPLVEIEINCMIVFVYNYYT